MLPNGRKNKEMSRGRKGERESGRKSQRKNCKCVPRMNRDEALINTNGNPAEEKEVEKKVTVISYVVIN